MVHADVGSCGDQKQESWKLPGLSPLSASPYTQGHSQEVCVKSLQQDLVSYE